MMEKKIENEKLRGVVEEKNEVDIEEINVKRGNRREKESGESIK